MSEVGPERYYHSNSPSGGKFSKILLEEIHMDIPTGGLCIGREYPVFLSENCRVSAPEYKTMKRMMTEEELWPWKDMSIL